MTHPVPPRRGPWYVADHKARELVGPFRTQAKARIAARLRRGAGPGKKLDWQPYNVRLLTAAEVARLPPASLAPVSPNRKGP